MPHSQAGRWVRNSSVCPVSVFCLHIDTTAVITLPTNRHQKNRCDKIKLPYEPCDEPVISANFNETPFSIPRNNQVHML